MQEPMDNGNETKQYYIYYGRIDSTKLERVLVDSLNVSIQLSQDDLNKTFVVQLSTVIESIESLKTIPVMQCKKLMCKFV